MQLVKHFVFIFVYKKIVECLFLLCLRHCCCDRKSICLISNWLSSSEFHPFFFSSCPPSLSSCVTIAFWVRKHNGSTMRVPVSHRKCWPDTTGRVGFASQSKCCTSTWATNFGLNILTDWTNCTSNFCMKDFSGTRFTQFSRLSSCHAIGGVCGICMAIWEVALTTSCRSFTIGELCLSAGHHKRPPVFGPTFNTSLVICVTKVVTVEKRSTLCLRQRRKRCDRMSTIWFRVETFVCVGWLDFSNRSSKNATICWRSLKRRRRRRRRKKSVADDFVTLATVSIDRLVIFVSAWVPYMIRIIDSIFY